MSGKLLFGIGDCPVCKWRTDGKNAMGLAQQHSNRTGHSAWAEMTYVMSPNPAKRLPALSPITEGVTDER
jgi:hypothetical protein